ncbi:hypothetical protein [Nonomuraea soli]|uniref:Uncharacterized protein n=1 Tax=Nonomuraea soli TaxID=1032476 RepID=A0A7W0CTD9_9ACTN|nr:hypothetical protein [Nonomuraea soli]MBA2896998.1 hypothetical protein [Nonomuraea soli]
MNDPGQNWFTPAGEGQPQQPQQPQPPQQQPQQPHRQAPPQQQRPPQRPQQRPQYPQQPPQPPQRLPQYPQRPSVRPDHQVWPPAGYEPVGSSTQPLPALPSAGPLFQPPHAGQPGQPGQPGPGQPPQPPGQPPTEPAEPTPPKRSRPVLLGIGAVAALVLAVGLPTGDRYLFYKSGQPSDIVHSLKAGASLDFEHVKWSATFGTADAPANRTPDPTRQWMKVVVTRTALDKDGTVLTAVPELAFKDAEGREWVIQMTKDNSPTDAHQVGAPYTIEFMGVVPPQLAKDVRLHLRPNTTYKSDTDVKELFRPATTAEEVEKAKHKDVLVFTQ